MISGNIYKAKNFTYNINKEVLKGKEVEVLAKVDENKIDQYFFSEGFFNFKDKSHLAKETKIKTHKDVFGDKIKIQEYMAHLHLAIKTKLLLTMEFLLAVNLMIIVLLGA